MRLAWLSLPLIALTACGGSGDRSATAPPRETAAPPPSLSTPNRAPVAINDFASVESGSLAVDVLSNDSDPDGDSLSIVFTGRPANGRVSIDSNGTPTVSGDDALVYEANPGFVGTDVFSYTVSDSRDGRANGYVSVVVGAVGSIPASALNQPPIAQTDNVSTQAAQTLSVDVLANDSDADNQPLQLLGFSGASNGSVERFDNDTPGDLSDDQLRYTPNPGFVGDDQMAYSITDGIDVTRGTVNVVVSEIGQVVMPPADACGIVTLGPVNAADVSLFEMDAQGLPTGLPVAQTLTDAQGRWCVNLPATRGSLLVQARGGFYPDPSDSRYEEGRARLIVLNEQLALESVLFDGETFAAVTVFSSAMVIKARREAPGDSFMAALDLNRIQATTAFGFDVLSSDVADPVMPEQVATDVSRRYAMTVGAAATSLNQLAVDLNVPAPNYLLVGALIRDLSECGLDGRDTAGPIEVLVAGVPQLISDTIDLNLQIVRFRNNLRAVYDNVELVQVDLPVCAQVVEPVDMTRPQLSAVPNNLAVFEPVATTLETTDARIQQFLSAPIASDDREGAVPVIVTLENGSPLPNALPLGTTLVTFSAVDTAGNAALPVTRAITLGRVAVPQAFADQAIGDEDSLLVIDVLANDFAQNSTLDPLSILITEQPTQGSAVVDPATGRINYQPFANRNGNDQLRYTVADADGRRSSDAPVQIMVLAVNDAPSAIADSASTTESQSVLVGVLENDVDFDDALNAGSVVITQAPTNGQALTDFVTGGIVYTPNAGFIGTDTLLYQVQDSLGASSAATPVDVTVVPSGTAPNRAPIAANDFVTLAEDTSLAIDVLVNDADSDGALVAGTLTLVNAPLHGEVTLGPGGVLEYTPDVDYFGVDSFRYQVADEQGAYSLAATVFATVTPINDAPVANDDVALGAENQMTSVSVLANDSDVDGLAGASVVIDVPPLFGAAVWDDVSAQVRYTPNLNFSGVDYMDYRVVDSAGAASQPARVSINVEGVNNAPVASADAFTVSPTDATPLEVLANDTDAEQVLQHSAIRIVSPPSVGSVGYDAAVDRLVYTPGSGFIGTTTFTYDLTDDQGAVSNIAEVVLTIESVEAAPMANNDVVATVEDIAVVVDVIANDTDVQDDIDVTSVVIVTPPASGGAVVNGSTGAITYTPNANFFGDDTFSYQVADATGLGSNIATVSVQVGPVNDPPVASGDVGITDEDTSITLNVAANDTDIDSAIDLASIVLQSFPTHGVATPDTLGNVIYTPNANFAGDDSFSYRVADVEGQLSGTAQVTVTVLAVNDTPVAVDDSVTTDENNAVVIDVLANDVDSDGLADIVSAQLVTGASIGAVTPGADTGQFSYTPNVNANGVDQFTYQLVDAAGATSNAATVTITITPVPSAPVVLDSSVSTRTGASLDIDVLVGSSDPESDIDVDTVSIESPAANGTAVALPGGVVRYTPNAAFEGADAFTFLVRDATGLASNTATVAVTVLPPNMAPQANDDDTTVVFSGETIEIDLSGQVSDSDGSVDLSTLSVFNLSEGAAMVLGASGIVRVDVPDTFTGIVTFEYTVEDNEGLLSNTATVTTVVWPAEDPDFDGIGSSIEIAVGTDPDMADSVYVFIDPDTPTATPDGTTWELAYPSIKAAADDGKLVETPGNTLYVLMASNNDVVTVADEWQLEVSANCSNMTIVGSLDPFVATPRFNAQGAPQTKLESVLAGERPLTLTDCDVVNLYYVTLTGGHGNLRGGGAFLVDVAIRFDHVHVIDNAAENRGGGIFVDNDSPSRVHIENALIANNVLTPQANLDSSGGGLHMVGNTDLTIIDSIIRHNEALVSGAVTKSNLAGGGGLFIRNTPLYLTGSKIMANKTGQCGGGVYVSGTDAMRVEHSSVSGNEAQQLGGGVCMQNTNANLTLHNNLITSNYADTGAGFYVADVDKSVISNNTVVFNLAGTSGGAFHFDTGGDPVFNYNIGQFNRAGDGSDEASGGIGQILGLDANYNFISNFWVNFVGTGNSDDPIEFDNGYYQLTSSPGVDYGPIDSNNPLYALDQRYTDRQGITTDVGTLDAGFHYLNPQPLAPNNAQIETDGNLVQNLDNQSLRVTPLIGSEPLGPGHRLYLREPTGSVATHIYTYSGTTLDPLGTGGSTQLRDLGDGRYEVLLDIAAAQPDFELVLYIDSITTPFLTITVTQ